MKHLKHHNEYEHSTAVPELWLVSDSLTFSL